MFPHPSLAEPDGLLGVGGDLTSERLILAYRFGIFPWYQEGIPIHWWYTHPRCVLFPSDLKVSKSMRPYFNQQKYRLTFDQCFQEVMDNSRQINRKGQESTWITGDMLRAYANLHAMGIA
ncbi:MAG: leucyl/phenylalanyl-tRNA--protein transferase, partial [Muriicola sp.]|nr:leucyl/phenylalanyl-tRNA--protein transferase [Muriicola sp.]